MIIPGAVVRDWVPSGGLLSDARPYNSNNNSDTQMAPDKGFNGLPTPARLS